MRNVRENRKITGGFTLIELMIAVAILAVLIAIAIPRFILYRQSACNAQAKTDARNFYTASLADSLDSVGDKTYSSSNQPDSYHGMVPISGEFKFTASTHSVTCDAAFKHPEGSKTYTLDSSGNINVSP